MPLTNKEQLIYNSFLVASRSVKNKPFKLRQDFSNIDSTTELTLKKLSSFFNYNSSVNLTDFFIAPYKCYGADSYFELQFYTTRKAIKCYSIYCRDKETQNPDNEDTISQCKQCCLFIYKFCRENNLTLQQYKSLIIGTTPATLQHLRDHKINFYTLHGLACDRTMRQLEPSLLEFFISDFNKLLNETRIKFQQSERLKKVVREALDLIEQKLLTFISSETTITT